MLTVYSDYLIVGIGQTLMGNFQHADGCLIFNGQYECEFDHVLLLARSGFYSKLCRQKGSTSQHQLQHLRHV